MNTGGNEIQPGRAARLAAASSSPQTSGAIADAKTSDDSAAESDAAFVTQLTANDVLFGRGAPSIDNEGNIRFRKIVQSRKLEYSGSSKRQYKDLIARQVIREVRNRKGRFVRRIESLVEAEKMGVPKGVRAWAVVDDETVLQKVKQALRDRNPEEASEGPKRERKRHRTPMVIPFVRDAKPDEEEEYEDDEDEDIGEEDPPAQALPQRKVVQKVESALQTSAAARSSSRLVATAAGASQTAAAGMLPEQRPRLDAHGPSIAASGLPQNESAIHSQSSSLQMVQALADLRDRYRGVQGAFPAPASLGYSYTDAFGGLQQAELGLPDSMWFGLGSAAQQQHAQIRTELLRQQQFQQRQQLLANTAASSGLLMFPQAGPSLASPTGVPMMYRSMSDSVDYQSALTHQRQLQQQLLSGAASPSTAAFAVPTVAPTAAAATNYRPMTSEVLADGTDVELLREKLPARASSLVPHMRSPPASALGMESSEGLEAKTRAEKAIHMAMAKVLNPDAYKSDKKYSPKAATAVSQAATEKYMDSLKCCVVEVLMLMVVSSYGIPVWSPRCMDPSFQGQDVLRGEMSSPGSDEGAFALTWTEMSTLLLRVVKDWSLHKHGNDGMHRAQRVLSIAAHYVSNPWELAKDVVALLGRMRSTKSLDKAKKGAKEYSKNTFLAIWMDRQLSLWAASMGIADPDTGHPVGYTSVDFTSDFTEYEREESLAAVACFDTSDCQTIWEQAACITKIRSAIVRQVSGLGKSESASNRILYALRESAETSSSEENNWANQPVWWRSDLLDPSSHDVKLIEGLLSHGYFGIQSQCIQVVTSELRIQAKSNLSFAELKMTKLMLQERAEQLTRMLAVRLDRSQRQSLLEDRVRSFLPHIASTRE